MKLMRGVIRVSPSGIGVLCGNRKDIMKKSWHYETLGVKDYDSSELLRYEKVYCHISCLLFFFLET